MKTPLVVAIIAGLAAPALASTPPVIGNLLVTEEGPGNVLEHDGVTGAYVQTFAVVPPPRFLMGVHSGGANGNVLVGSNFGGVREYDRNTGALIKTYNPSGGWQWAGLYRPNGNVIMGDWNTDDIREYDGVTGNLVGTFSPPGIIDPADMVFGPGGNLFVCSFNGGVYELDGTTGSLINLWAPGIGRANDILFMPDGRRIVTSMTGNIAHVFDSSWNPITTFAGTGWGRVHGIDLSPVDGRIYVVDGVSQAVHSFDPTTYAEINASFLTTPTKPVDLEFVRPIPAPGVGALLAGAALWSRRRRR
jgi:WD40 repeat protein